MKSMALMFLLAGQWTALPAMAQSTGTGPATADTRQWACQFCSWPVGWHGLLDAGPGWVSDSSLSFANYRGLDEEGGFLALGGQVSYRDARDRYIDLHASDLGLDSRRLEARGGRRGRYQVRLAFSEIPTWRGFGARTPFLGTGGGALSLPDGWVPGNRTGDMAGLPAALAPAPLKILRRTMDAGFSHRPASRWQWEVDVQRSRKDGTRPFSGGVLTLQSSHFPAPVDFTTDRVVLSATYTGERSSFQAGLSGSWFDNGQASISWQNPFNPPPGTELLRSALEPDNQAQNLHLAGAWTPSPGLRLAGSVRVGRARQDQTFLPYTTNPLVPDSPLPRASLDGKIDAYTLNLAGRLSARLSPRMDFDARLKLDERDNRTPVQAWNPVIEDLTPRSGTLNRPYSFQRRKLSLEARYRSRSDLRLRAGAGREDLERGLQSVAETRENTFWGEVNWSPWAAARLRLKAEAGNRDASSYEPFSDPGLPVNPLMRKFNLADRERRRLTLEIDLQAHDRLDLALAWLTTDDRYRHSPIGLQQSKVAGLNLDAGYALRPGTGLHAFVSLERLDSLIFGQQNLAQPWRSESRDEFISAGLGAQLQLGRAWESGLDYVVSIAEGEIHTAIDAADRPFPTLETDLRNLRAYLAYRSGPNWDWKLFVEHEAFDSDDWQVDGLDVDGIEAILTMGLVSPDHDVTVLRLLGTYRF